MILRFEVTVNILPTDPSPQYHCHLSRVTIIKTWSILTECDLFICIPTQSAPGFDIDEGETTTMPGCFMWVGRLKSGLHANTLPSEPLVLS